MSKENIVKDAMRLFSCMNKHLNEKPQCSHTLQQIAEEWKNGNELLDYQ